MSEARTSGKFGPRYGAKVRRNYDQTTEYDDQCPECGADRIEKESSAIWICGKCGEKFAGGAYEPDSGAAEMLDRALQVETEELEAAKEELDE